MSSSPRLLGATAKAITGRGQLQARHLDRLVALGEPVAGAGLLELGDGADVARPELLDVLGVLAGEHDQLADALLGVGACVQHLAVGAQRRPGRRAAG